nr:MAG TPA_asm: hypothetical protein [Caudoviricetes sp.]
MCLSQKGRCRERGKCVASTLRHTHSPSSPY